MPEFDTYHAIERYARNPNDLEAALAYKFLKRRTRLAIMWRAVCNFGASNMETASVLQTGAFASANKHAAKAMDLGSMTEEERKAMFMDAIEETGIQLDPETLAAINNQGNA